MKVSIEEARSFLVKYHNLTGTHSLNGVDGVLKYMTKVRCIQYDPLNIIGRNTDLVLQARVIDYKPEMLLQLLYKDRLLVDGWDKMMSVYPSEDWAFFHFVREQKGIEAVSILKNRESDDALKFTEVVLDSLAKNGPMEPKQIPLGAAGKNSWGHRNLSSATLDYLYHVGKVGVYTKKNVNKVYDLIERLLPESLLSQPNPFKNEYDFMKWYVYRRLGSVGMLWNKNGGGWLATLMPNKNTRKSILDEYIAEEKVQRIEVDGVLEPFYIRSSDAHLFESTFSKAVRFLAPLDNILWERDMLSKIFDFNYTWEVYVPADKRKYGYYVIPVLYGNRFIARFEPEKSKTTFQIKNWWWEKDVSVSDKLINLILKEMKRLAECFNKTDGVHKSTEDIIRNPSHNIK